MSDFLHIASARYVGGYRLHLCFTDGSEGEVDLQDELIGPMFEPLRDFDAFRSFTLAGGTIEWPNGADFAPEFLQQLLRLSPVH